MKKTSLALVAAIFALCATVAHADGSRIKVITQAKGANSDLKAATFGVAELQADLASADAEIAALRADADRARAKGPLESAIATAKVAEAEDKARATALERLHKLTSDVDTARQQLSARLVRLVGKKPDARVARQLLSPEASVVRALISGNRLLARLQARLAASEVRAYARDLAGSLRALDDSETNLANHLENGGDDLLEVESEEPEQPELLRLIADRKSH